MPPPYLTYSWIALTSISPLSALLLTWTLFSIVKKRTHASKHLLLLFLIASQLLLSILNFTYSLLTLFKIIEDYVPYFTAFFHFLVVFKSLSALSVQIDEFYKIKSPSNYLLNISSSFIKYHLLVIGILSVMGAYFLSKFNFVPLLLPGADVHGVILVGIYCFFHSVVLGTSLLFLGLKLGKERKKNGDGSTVVIGTNSTSSSANLFGGRDGVGSRDGNGASVVGILNLIINNSLIACVFSILWLPSAWPLSNILLCSQLFESILTSVFYWLSTSPSTPLVHSKTFSNSPLRFNESLSSSRSDSSRRNRILFPITNSSLCFNNGEFQYFAPPKNNTQTMLNNFNTNTLSSPYNTFDSFHQTRSYNDSLRCGSVTTIANDDFEFVSRSNGGQESQIFTQNFIFSPNDHNSLDSNSVDTSPPMRELQNPNSNFQPMRELQNPVSKNAQPMRELGNLCSNFKPTREPRGASSTNFQPIRELREVSSTNFKPIRELCGASNTNFQPIRELRDVSGTNFQPMREVRSSSSNSDAENSSHALPSLSMNDLDLIGENENSSLKNSSSGERVKYKYKKRSPKIRKRFISKNNSRRVLSLESLSTAFNDSKCAYLDTGERVIVFTTEFL